MIEKKHIQNIYLFSFFTFGFVDIIPSTLSNINLPLDTIEALAWGSNLEWGFNKHPPLSAFLTNFLLHFWPTRLGILFS